MRLPLSLPQVLASAYDASYNILSYSKDPCRLDFPSTRACCTGTVSWYTWLLQAACSLL